MKFVFYLFAMLAGAAPALAQDSSASDWIRNPIVGRFKAYAEFKMGNYRSARNVWEVLAGIGDSDALFNLGVLAENGFGEPMDLQKALSLFKTAADAGGVNARYRLGLLYSSDEPDLKDLDKARHYFGLAAAAGNVDAISRLASLEHSDRPLSEFEQAEQLSSGGRQAEAAAIYQRLADAGDAHAQARLAWMYERGLGVERNLEEAGRRFLLAGKAGDAEAQYALAVMFKTGKGQPFDSKESRDWLKRAAAQNYPAAVAALTAQEKDQ
ncbi:tetratricopeptide repeat protein [Rhodoblastus sp.]|uniref:tetratricopeptide repeat protein n=1 Tax=Rhodoblastus sp. TaxID=1962975 RepID=UPI003F978C7B